MDLEEKKVKAESIIDQLDKECHEDIKLTISNLSEKTFFIPTIKHKWVGKMMRAKKEERILKEEREKRITFKLKEIKDNLKVSISEKEFEKLKQQNHQRIDEIDDLLYLAEVKREYLEKIVNNLSFSLTKDVSNIIEMQKLEMQ